MLSKTIKIDFFYLTAQQWMLSLRVNLRNNEEIEHLGLNSQNWAIMFAATVGIKE